MAGFVAPVAVSPLNPGSVSVTSISTNVSSSTDKGKPSNNKTDIKPDYYIHKSDNWLVFPHELEGLNFEEIKKNKPEMKNLIDKIASLK